MSSHGFRIPAAPLDSADKRHAMNAGAVVVGLRPDGPSTLAPGLDLEAHRGVKRDRRSVVRRGYAAHLCAPSSGAHVEEPLIQGASDARAASVGRNAHEVDVALVRSTRRQEADEKPNELAFPLGHKARAREVLEPEARYERGPLTCPGLALESRHRPPSLQGARDDGVVVFSGGPNVRKHQVAADRSLVQARQAGQLPTASAKSAYPMQLGCAPSPARTTNAIRGRSLVQRRLGPLGRGHGRADHFLQGPDRVAGNSLLGYIEMLFQLRPQVANEPARILPLPRLSARVANPRGRKSHERAPRFRP